MNKITIEIKKYSVIKNKKRKDIYLKVQGTRVLQKGKEMELKKKKRDVHEILKNDPN